MLDFVKAERRGKMDVYRHTQSLLRVSVPPHELMEDDYARLLLRQAGMPKEAIERFIEKNRE
jgi:hypothetical protein